MTRIRRNISKDELSVLIVVLVLLIGGWLRYYQTTFGPFPMNDGGMFYAMINDLRDNNYVFPTHLSYNQSHIPPTYPPLPFYLAGVIADLTGISVINILRWFPVMITTLTILVVYQFAQTIFSGDKSKAAMAASVYAFMPITIFWTLMGGGLTRSLGQLLLLLFVQQVYILITKGKLLHLLYAIIFGSLLVLCHPEATLHAAGFAVMIWLVSARTKRVFFLGILITSGVLLVTSIWWIPLIVQYGLSPFITVTSSSGVNPISWLGILFSDITFEPQMTLIAVFAFIGIWAQVARRNYLIIAWLIIPFLIDPRSAKTTAAIPLSLLSAVSLADVLFPTLTNNESQFLDSYKLKPLKHLASPLFALFSLIYVIINGLFFITQFAPNRLQPENIQTMEWVKSNTPIESQFIILTGQALWACDPIQEWFPALTERSSLTTLQGQEWLLGPEFVKRAEEYRELQACTMQQVDCMEQIALESGFNYDYVYVVKSLPTSPCQATTRSIPSVVASLMSSYRYISIYDSEDAAIFLNIQK